MRYYFKSSQSFVEAEEGEETGPADLKIVLDQKHYLEEMNRTLMSRVHAMKQHIAHLENAKHDSSFEVLDSSSEVIVPSSPLLNGLLRSTPPTQETPEEKLSKELDSVNHVKNEMEVAMKLLEKDIHEKQDTIISIRRQLEDIKTINISLFQKTKQFESDMKEKDNKIMKQDHKIASCLKTISQLESKIKSMEEKKTQLEEIKNQQEKQIEQINCETTTVEAELRRERDRSQSLLQSRDSLEADLTKMSIELEEAKQNLKEYHRLKKEFLVLQKKCAEYELSLEEVGVQLKE
jgi:chromosome segregation ATPase